MELTKQQILAERPGRVLNSWIAENVFGLTVIRERRPDGDWWIREKQGPMVRLPNYSTEIVASLEAEKKAIVIDPLVYTRSLCQVVWYGKIMEDTINEYSALSFGAVSELLEAGAEQRGKAALLTAWTQNQKNVV